jgi:hypothetical protein
MYAEVRVRVRVSLCEICDGQSDTGTGFSPSSSIFLCQYHPSVAACSYVIWGMNSRLFSDRISCIVSAHRHEQQ